MARLSLLNELLILAPKYFVLPFSSNAILTAFSQLLFLDSKSLLSKFLLFSSVPFQSFSSSFFSRAASHFIPYYFSPVHCKSASFLNTVYRREGGFRRGSSIKARGGLCGSCPLSHLGQHLLGVSLYQCMSKQERSLLTEWLLF